ncbi:MAG TPA: acetyl-coenzyme A synthetase, partial [Solibacterales bacterium]|nr:acetyl-coenzyme A synthetase [Bryobacterales bacterium]
MSISSSYPPNEDFVRRAHVQGMDGYRQLYRRAEEKPEEFWGELAEKELAWFEPWNHVFEWKPPFVKWFVGGKLNASYNCLDRHLNTARRNKAAILFEGEPGDQRAITYQELHRLVCRFANVLKGLGVAKGDRVTIYLPMIPEAVVAMLACARIGAIHSVVFAGFSSEAFKHRVRDSACRLVITVDGYRHGNKTIGQKEKTDQGLSDCPSVKTV